MQMLGFAISTRMLILWAVLIIAGGAALTALLLVILRNPGTRALPRRSVAASPGQAAARYAERVAETQARWTKAHDAYRRERPPGSLTESRERIVLPWTPPAPPGPPRAAPAPRIVPDVWSLAVRIGAWYLRADEEASRVLYTAGWRSWH